MTDPDPIVTPPQLIAPAPTTQLPSNLTRFTHTGHPFGPPVTETPKSYSRGSAEHAATINDKKIPKAVLAMISVRMHDPGSYWDLGA